MQSSFGPTFFRNVPCVHFVPRFEKCSLDLTVNWEFILWKFNATNMLVYVCHTLVPHSTILSNFSLV
jgi:hypothetical protein